MMSELKRAEAMARANAMEAEARELAGKARELRREAAQIVAESWGCSIGTVVMTGKGEVRVSGFNCYHPAKNRPSIEGYRRKKNGDWYADRQYIGSGWKPIDE